MFCSCSEANVLPSEQTTAFDSEQTTEQTTKTTSDETTLETTELTTTETEFVTSLPYLRTVDFDGEHIPDGIYMYRPISIDADRKGCTADIFAFPYLLEGDVNLLKEGDSLYWARHLNNGPVSDIDEASEHICNYIYRDDKGNITSVCFDGYVWCLSKHPDGQYIVMEADTGQCCITNAMAESYHISFSEDLHIFDGFPIWPFGALSEKEHIVLLNGYNPFTGEPILYEDEAVSLYLENNPGAHELGASFQYRNIDDFVHACNELSLWGGGGLPAIVIVVENQTITEMFLNAPLHQPWRFINEESRYDSYKKNPYTEPIRIED